LRVASTRILQFIQNLYLRFSDKLASLFHLTSKDFPPSPGALIASDQNRVVQVSTFAYNNYM